MKTAALQKSLLLLGLICTWVQILRGMNDLIHFDAEPLPSTNAEENKFAVLNQMENVEPAKVKYEGMCQFMKTNVCKQILCESITAHILNLI